MEAKLNSSKICILLNSSIISKFRPCDLYYHIHVILCELLSVIHCVSNYIA